MPANTADSPARAVTWEIPWTARGATELPEAATVPKRMNLPAAPAAQREVIIFSSETVEIAFPTSPSTSDWISERGLFWVCGGTRSKRFAPREERRGEIPFGESMYISPHRRKKVGSVFIFGEKELMLLRFVELQPKIKSV